MSNDTLPKNKESIVKNLFKLGAHFGFTRSRRHPSVSPYIYGFKNRTAIVDLEKSLEALEAAQEFIKKIGSEGKQILFVGNKNEARGIIKKYAEVIDMPYVNERWVGGTFTNFKQIRSRIEKMKDWREKGKTGGLAVYTKRERGMIAKEMEKMGRLFTGIENMEKLPGAIFTIDAKEEAIAIAEAQGMKIPVVALCGTDCDIRSLAYPIVANDASRATIEFFTDAMAQAYREGKTMAQNMAKEKLETAVDKKED